MNCEDFLAYKSSVESSSSGVIRKKVGIAGSRDFSTDTANFRHNFDRQLWIFNMDDYR